MIELMQWLSGVGLGYVGTDAFARPRQAQRGEPLPRVLPKSRLNRAS
jgi:hypothetical protein